MNRGDDQLRQWRVPPSPCATHEEKLISGLGSLRDINLAGLEDDMEDDSVYSVTQKGDDDDDRSLTMEEAFLSPRPRTTGKGNSGSLVGRMVTPIKSASNLAAGALQRSWRRVTRKGLQDHNDSVANSSTMAVDSTAANFESPHMAPRSSSNADDDDYSVSNSASLMFGRNKTEQEVMLMLLCHELEMVSD